MPGTKVSIKLCACVCVCASIGVGVSVSLLSIKRSLTLFIFHVPFDIVGLDENSTYTLPSLQFMQVRVGVISLRCTV
jgi:hypothetical protein